MKKKMSGYKWLLLAAIVILILFVSSSMTYKEQTSVPFLERYLSSQPLAGFLSRFHFVYAGAPISIAAIGYYKFVEFFIRKGAHFGTYFLVGLFGSLGLRDFVKPTWLRAVLTVLSTCGLAAFDEFHQLLTGDRTPLFQDVMLDTTAALIAVCLTLIFARRGGKQHPGRH